MSTYFLKRQVCPACKSGKYKKIYSSRFIEYLESKYYLLNRPIQFEYLINSEFILNECSYCGLIYQEEIPNDFLMNKIYEEWIDPVKALEENKNNSLETYLIKTQEIIALIAYFNRTPSQLNFLDFGMGWGRWCRVASALGCKSYGTELSDERIEYAKSNGIKVVSWEDLPNHKFHVINTDQVLEHIAEPLETLNYLKKALKSNGLLKISVPNGVGIKRRLIICDWTAPKSSRNSLNPVAPLEHINCFNYKSIIKMADLAGFEQIKIPLRTQYSYTIYGRKTLKVILKNMLRPVYRNLFSKGTYMFLRQKEENNTPDDINFPARP